MCFYQTLLQVVNYIILFYLYKIMYEMPYDIIDTTLQNNILK